MSPALRIFFFDGIPWTTTSLTEVQIEPVKPLYPRKDGLAPRLTISSCAI